MPNKPKTPISHLKISKDQTKILKFLKENGVSKFVSYEELKEYMNSPDNNLLEDIRYLARIGFLEINGGDSGNWNSVGLPPTKITKTGIEILQEIMKPWYKKINLSNSWIAGVVAGALATIVGGYILSLI